MEPMEFYESMARAIKARDHARNMASRWNAKALDLDIEIEALIKLQEQATVNQEV